MFCRGIRGAISVDINTEDAILQATRHLLEQIVLTNKLSIEDVAGMYFTATPDLNAAYPARAARELGWTNIALMCAQEMIVPGSLPRCIRVLVLWNTKVASRNIKHIYLKEARSLRPDISEIIKDEKK